MMRFYARRCSVWAVLAASLAASLVGNGWASQPQAVTGLTRYTFGTPSGDEAKTSRR